MTRYVLHRLIVFCIRLTIAAIILVTLIEVGYCVFGGSDTHVWEIAISEDLDRVFPDGEFVPNLKTRILQSSFVILIAYGGTVVVGYAWGILGARLRRFRARLILAAPLTIFACAPAFWLVVCVAVFSFFQWKRPGFADDLVVETGPDILQWWNAAVVALPLLAVAASWQLRAVAGVLEKEASQPFVTGLFLSGYQDEDIFHRNIAKRSGKQLISLFDQTLPVILGGLIVSEWAFHYEGMGALAVDAVKSASYLGIFIAGMWSAVLIGFAEVVRELVCQEERRGA
ncbi:MAG: ABC transporter permease subunit [Verrucomicrobiales bacterium]